MRRFSSTEASTAQGPTIQGSAAQGSIGGPITATREGVRVVVRLTPKASISRIQGVVRDAAGNAMLKVAVAPPPVDGRANAALLELLAREWNLPRRDLTLVSGAKDRTKIVAVAGETAALVSRLTAALATLPAA